MTKRPPGPERLWRPQSIFRFAAGMACAVTLPVLVTKAVLSGYTAQFPSLLYIVAVVIAAMVGRFLAGAVATAVSLALIYYYVLVPTGSHPLDLAVFGVVGLLITGVLAGTDRSRGAALLARQAADAAHQRVTMLAEASRILSASFDLKSTIAQVCERVAHDGGWYHVIVLQQQNGGLHYLGGAHAGGAREADLEALEAPEAVAAVQSRQILMLDAPGWRTSKFGPWRYRSGLVVPLISGAETHGILILLHVAKGHTYSPNDLVYAGEIGGRIASSVENASRYHQQVHIAHTLQQGLLPRSVPDIKGANVYVRYQAGAGTEVGGDFYDVFGIGDNRWMAIIGDVCGKGPEAATVMSVTRATLRALALHEPSPKRLLAKLNEALITLVPDDRFVTVSCAVFEIMPEGGARVRLARAGHPAPVITTAGKPPRLANGKSGMLLGAFPEVVLHEKVVELAPGEAITFYTDGIESRDMAAEDKAMQLLREHGDGPADSIAARFANAVPGEMGSKADDLVVLTFEVVAAQHPARV